MSGAQGRQEQWKPRYNPWLVAVTVTLGAFMEVLDTTIVNVSLPHIAGSLSVSPDEATWTLTTYLVANGIVLTISGALSRRFGRKRYFLACLAGFTVCSLGCGISTEFWQILLFRGLQGFCGGGLQPTQQAIILDSFPPEKRSAAFAVTAVAIVIAPVLGPMVGGWLTDTYSWHYIFLINLPIGALTILGVLQIVEDPPSVAEEMRRAGRFDYIGVGFIALALGGLEIAVDRGEDYDWFGSDFVRVTALASAVGFVGGIAYLLYARKPIVDLRVFKDRNFALATVQIAIMGFVLYASAVLIPQLSQQQLGYTATWAGLLLTPDAVVLAFLIPAVGRVSAFFPTKYTIALGGLALGLSLFYSSGLTPDIDFAELAVMRAAQTVGLAFLFAPLSTVAFSTLPKELNSDATELFTMARNVMGGIGISVSTALITDHMQIRQAHMVEHLTPVHEPYNVTLQEISRALVGMGYSAAQAGEMAAAQMFQILRQQAAVLAYSDVFVITGIISLAIVPTALFMAGTKGQGGGAPG
jgi:DHA2 family multidrug resistance protein